MDLTALTHAASLLPDWGLALVLLFLTLTIASLLFRVVRRVLRRQLRVGHNTALAITERIAPAAHAAILLLTLALVLPNLPLPERTDFALHRLVMAAFLLLAGWAGILASNLAIDRYLGRLRIDTPNNLMARKVMTQMHVLKRTVDVAIGLIALAAALMNFETVRQYGVSLFASAGIAGLAIGLAAKPLLGNLIAGIQLAITQPIRIDDVVVIEGEWGRIESFTATYVVIAIWDQRRLIVPLSYFLEKPIQNWTHSSAELLGSIMLYTDYTVPVAAVREKFAEIIKTSPLWDGRVAVVQVTDITDRSMQIRALMSAQDSSALFDLRCDMREKLLAFLQSEYPGALPRLRADLAEPHS